MRIMRQMQYDVYRFAVLCLIFSFAVDAVSQDDIDYTPGSTPWKADASTVAAKSAKRTEFNYQESLVPKYSLPDPLVTQAGKAVATAEEWAVRRQELLELFRHNVYGVRPSAEYSTSFEVVKQRSALDGQAIARLVKIAIEVDGRGYNFLTTCFIPTQASETTPAPALVHINNRYFLDIDAAEKNDPFWPVKDIIARGYATASFHTSDVDPDRKGGFPTGVRAVFSDGIPPDADDWRALSAWGWAASRVLDYFEQIPEVDATRCSVSGHSRGGKTALWAAAEDTRFRVAYSNNSGCGGAALSRRRYGETIARITEVFPHWFCENLTKYADREDELPVDQHQLISLIAPRAVYVTSSDTDLWADPRGEYTSLREAAPVFELLERKAITSTEMPPLNSPRHVGSTGYHIRRGGHGLGTQDWSWFMDFADRHLK